MGYSHYVHQKKTIPQRQWERICMKTFQVLDYCAGRKIRINYEYDVPKPPQVNDEVIRFNGWGPEGHETFMLHKKKPDLQSWQEKGDDYFNFCKTARKPYDLAVTLVMLVIISEAPKCVTLSSDGDWDAEDEWVPARNVYKELFGEEPSCPFENVGQTN